MSLLGVGSATRKRAIEGFGAVADMDTRERAIRENIEMQKRAQQGQTLGTAAGIGSMVGVKKLAAAQEPFRQGLAGLNKLAGDAGTFSARGLGGTNLTTGSGEVIKNITDVSQVPAELLNTMGANQAAATGTTLTQGTTQAGTAITNTIGAGSTSTGIGATLGSLAAPIGIALGVGFLLNKLFDQVTDYGQNKNGWFCFRFWNGIWSR